MDKIKPFLSYIQEIYNQLLKFVKEKPQTTLKIVAGFFLILSVFYGLFLSSPSQFPVQSTITISEGSTLSGTASYLKEQKVIKSAFIFKAIVYLTFNQKSIFAGDYYLPTKRNVFNIADRVTHGEFELELVSITIPEGATVKEIGKLMSTKFNLFDEQNFVRIAEESEGYLFPDTYYFLPNVKERQVKETMLDNFNIKIVEIESEISEFGVSLPDVIIMASILEEEARTTESRRNIADILWKRIEIGMPLQVDAVFSYIKGENIPLVSFDDLKIDSPYNTYLYKGLPIGPITNPGLDSILAAINPIENNYYYYLSDRQGNMHYAETFGGHKLNRSRYLR